MMAYGFPTALLAGMERAGLVAVAIDTVRAAGTRMVAVRRIRITDAGWQALADPAAPRVGKQ